jgi:hypothetical protein
VITVRSCSSASAAVRRSWIRHGSACGSKLNVEPSVLFRRFAGGKEKADGRLGKEGEEKRFVLMTPRTVEKPCLALRDHGQRNDYLLAPSEEIG